MLLGTVGKIFAVTIAIYVPIFFSANRICFKYGIREKGWSLLVIFSLFHIIGGALGIASTQTNNVSFTLACYAFKASDLSPLLLSTLGLIETIALSPDGKQKHARKYWPLYIVGTIALILAFVGVTSSSRIPSIIGALLFAGLYVILVAVTLLNWGNRHQLMKYRKQLLVVVTAALPFLAVRVVYSILSTFNSAFHSPGPQIYYTPLPEFYLMTGKWQIYVGMVLVMEFAVVLIYTIAGNMLPLDQDYLRSDPDEYPLNRPEY